MFQTGKYSTGPLPAVSEFLSSISLPANLFPPSLDWAELETDLKFLKIIGTGGMGIVLLAQPSSGGGPVALKVLKPEVLLHAEAFKFFVRESLHLARLVHPNIIPVLDRSRERTVPWFTMPYISGGNLTRFLRGSRPMENSMVLSFALQLSGALVFAHDKGIIHRDLKPSNILIQSTHTLLLADFGLSRSLFNDEMLRPDLNFVEGTPQYQPANALEGKHGDTRDDIYSFGALLYEMLSGRPPFPGKTRAEVLTLMQTGPPPEILQLNPGADPGLAKIAQAAIDLNLEERYAGMLYIQQDLERIRAGEAPLGPRGQFKQSFSTARQFSKVRPRTLVLCALLLLTGLFIAGGRLFQPMPIAQAAIKAPPLQLLRSFRLPESLVDSYSLIDGNFNPSPVKEIYGADDTAFQVFSATGEFLTEWIIPPGGRGAQFGIAADTDADGLDEAFVSWVREGESAISVINANAHELKRFSIQGMPLPSLDSHRVYSVLRAKAFYKTAEKALLLATVETGQPRFPRQISCYDFDSGSLLWTHHVAAYPKTVLLHDLGGDQSPEVILGTDAVNNGAERPDGTTDQFSYLYAFSLSGPPLWTFKTGDTYTEPHPLSADLNGDNQPELYAWIRRNEYASNHLNSLGRIIQLDARGQITAEVDLGARISSCEALPPDRSGSQQLLAADWEGNVHVIGQGLQLLRSKKLSPKTHDRVHLQVFVSPGSHEGEPSVLVSTAQQETVSGHNRGDALSPPNYRIFHDISLHVLNRDLKNLGRVSLLKRSERDFIRKVWFLDNSTLLCPGDTMTVWSLPK